MPKDQVEVYRKVLPNRKAQESWHRTLEDYFTSRGTMLKIFQLMGRWEISEKKKK